MKQGRDASRLTDHLGYWMRVVSNHVSHSFARRLEGRGVTTAEWVVLRVLYDVDVLSPSLVAEQIGMTRGGVSKLADRLIQKNMISRAASSHDKRAHMLRLTALGRRLVPELARLADENDEAVFGVLDRAARLRLDAMLRRIVEVHALREVPVD
jgi:DNA-binding MarR family transcriptional regulator